jgi:hypothetical protein
VKNGFTKGVLVIRTNIDISARFVLAIATTGKTSRSARLFLYSRGHEVDGSLDAGSAVFGLPD